MPPLPSRHQPEAGNVWSMEEDRLQVEVPHLMVEDRNAAAVQYWCLCCCESIPAQLPHENLSYDLCILEDDKVDIPL